jgi:hypothetical protein
VGLAALVVLVGCAAIFAAGGSATTAPSVAYPVKVTITDSKVHFSTLVGKRGYTAVFHITNVGKKPHRLNIGGITTKLLKPNGRSRLGANMEERGRYPYKVDNGGKGYTGFFIVT